MIAQLKPGREKSVLRRHPWVFSGAISEVSGNPGVGDTIKIISSQGDFLAWGAYSPLSQIRIRIWTWNRDITIDKEFFAFRLQKAIQLRNIASLNQITNAIRLVHGESDGLPGLIVDQYGDFLVVQFLSAGVEKWRELITESLLAATNCSNIYERSDVDVRKLEGLPLQTGTLRGVDPPEYVRVFENQLDFWVDIQRGHKTGGYLDQRKNRRILREFAKDREVLDCFSYTGGFLVNALAGGARSVLALEISKTALQLSRENVGLNSLANDKVDWFEGDVFSTLRSFRDQGSEFDLILLDPPKFAPTSAQVEKAARGYKDINLLALKLLRPNGLLFTFSCSGGVNAELFQKIIAGAALDAGVEAQIIKTMRQDMDHPVALSFPESEYLKGLVIRKIS